jgi:adenylate cyclase
MDNNVTVVLKIIGGPDSGTIHPLRSFLSIGRDPSNELQLRDTKSSRCHASIQLEHGDYKLTDLGSRNGTWLNDRSVKSATLVHGDRIYIGDTVLEFVNSQQLSTKRNSNNSICGGKTNGGLTLIINSEDEYIEEAALSGHTFAVSDADSGLEYSGEDLDQLKLYSNRLKKLYEANRILASLKALPELLESILKIMFEFLPGERGVILLDEGKNGFVPVAGLTKDGCTDEEIPVSSTLLAKVISDRIALISGNIMQDTRFDPSASIVAQGITSCLTVPMVIGQTVLGVIHLDTRGSYAAFSDDDLEVVSAIANQAAVAVQNASLMEQARTTAVARDNLSRYLAPEIIESIMSGESEVSMCGEMKTATILFADIRGFTTLSENVPPSIVIELLNQYFEIMVDCILDSSGVVDKFVGDEIMAVWGVPEAKDNDVFNAVSAAVKMQQSLHIYNQKRLAEGSSPIYMGIGINTGPVVAGNLGSSRRMQYTVIGDSVNQASRLEGLTGKEQIIISEATWVHVKDRIKVVDLGDVSVKGKQDTIHAFEVKGLVDTRTVELGRTSQRISIALPIRCMKVKSREIFQSVLIDISEGGAGVRCGIKDLSALEKKEVVVLGLMIPGMGKILIKSEVVRIKLDQSFQSDVGFFAVRFINPPDNIAEVIDELLLKGEAAEIDLNDASE